MWIYRQKYFTSNCCKSTYFHSKYDSVMDSNVHNSIEHLDQLRIAPHLHYLKLMWIKYNCQYKYSDFYTNRMNWTYHDQWHHKDLLQDLRWFHLKEKLNNTKMKLIIFNQIHHLPISIVNARRASYVGRCSKFKSPPNIGLDNSLQHKTF